MSRTLVADVRLFDGHRVRDRMSVLFSPNGVEAVASEIAATSDVLVIDGRGKTLMPGLIDAHVHAKKGAQEQALAFGVTTELDMGSDPEWMSVQRLEAARRDDLADIRSSSFGATVLGGWPSGAIGIFFPRPFPVVASVADIAGFVADRIGDGADYIKLFIDDGSALGLDVPALPPAMSDAIVEEAHSRGLMAVAHALTLHGAAQAISSGADGLVHVFMDQAPTDEMIHSVVDAGAFVVPTLCALGSMAGELTGESLARDPRNAGLFADDWADNLCACGPSGSPASLAHAMAATRALHEAGVPILAGTDAACVGVLGTAHGVSVHAELELLTRCGLSPVDALRAATSATAERFRLTDRGEVRRGLNADLLLIDGDPTTTITDSLSLVNIWRNGRLFDRDAYRASLEAAASPLS